MVDATPNDSAGHARGKDVLTDGDPDVLSHLLIQRRKVEHITQNSCVEDFDPDVTIKQRCNETADEGDGVAERLI